MPKFTVSRSLIVGASLDKCFSTVRDFKSWPKWSPWLIAEPDCAVSFGEDERSYSWDGKIVGAGKMEIESESPNRSINYQLEFLRPWKSTSKVRFTFAEKGEDTEITWRMDGRLPFFMFWMKTMMSALIGMDYERGLSMLKDLLETGIVPSKLEFIDFNPCSGGTFVGIRTHCSIKDIGSTMENDFKRLCSLVDERRIEVIGKPFSIYHKWEVVKGNTEYTVGYIVNGASADLPRDVVSGVLPDCKAYAIRHTGPYRHLGNAWAAGMFRARAKVFKQSKKIHPFEIYENDPSDVPENEVETIVHFPLK